MVLLARKTNGSIRRSWLSLWLNKKVADESILPVTPRLLCLFQVKDDFRSRCCHDGKITGGRSLKEEIGTNWPNLPTSATLRQILAWPSLIFGILPILHETDIWNSPSWDFVTEDIMSMWRSAKSSTDRWWLFIDQCDRCGGMGWKLFATVTKYLPGWKYLKLFATKVETENSFYRVEISCFEHNHKSLL